VSERPLCAPASLRHSRLRRQLITRSPATDPAQVVAALGAVQAQDYLGSLWAIGLRCPGATAADVERAIADRAIVRTWPMRGTLHLVPAADVRWLLWLLAPRILAAAAGRHRQLGLDEATFARSREAFVTALHDGGRLTRDAMYQVLERAGVSTAGQRGYHILWRLGQEGLICFGPRAGRQHTFVLLDEWASGARDMERDEALATLAVRYFTGHGPATLGDFAWWSGLAAADARAALAMASAGLTHDDIDGTEHWTVGDGPPCAAKWPAGEWGDGPSRVELLPAFDEYLVGYRDRAALLDPRHAGRVVPGGGGMLVPTIVSDGRVIGTWKRELKKDTVVVIGRPFGELTRDEGLGFSAAAERYGGFLGRAAKPRLDAPA
jgi:hypothetical protein